MKRVIAVVPASYDEEKIRERLSNIGLVADDTQMAVLSKAGKRLDIDFDREINEPAHIFATPPSNVDAVAVMREFPALYGTDFILAWIAGLAGVAKQGLWLDLPEDTICAARGWVTRAMLAEKLPDLHQETVGQWLKLNNASGELDLSRLHTIMTEVAGGFGDFASTVRSCKGDKMPATSIVNTFIYSLFGAMQKSFAFRAILDWYGIEKPLNILDCGGGYGFLLCELACAGHRGVVYDHDEHKINTIGPWLSDRCGVADRIEFLEGSLEKLEELDGEYDCVSFFGSLLYADRARVPDILLASMRMLKAGGLLLIHENSQDVVKPGIVDYEKRFRADELRALLRQNAGEPQAFSIFSGAAIDFDKAAKSVLLLAVRKA